MFCERNIIEVGSVNTTVMEQRKHTLSVVVFGVSVVDKNDLVLSRFLNDF